MNAHVLEKTQKPILDRNVWLAGTLGLFAGPVAQVYCGRMRRAFAVESFMWVFFLVGFAIALYSPFGSVSIAVAVLLLLAVRIGIVLDAVVLARKQTGEIHRPYQKWWAYLLLIVLFGTFDMAISEVRKRFWFEAFIVPSRPMEDTILRGDRILVDKRDDPLKSGDIVVFSSEGPGSALYCMRIIGMPGDTVEIRNEKVFRNGQPMSEPYVKIAREKIDLPNSENYGPEKIPDGSVFLLGDNRRHSRDSRFLGFISVDDILGRVTGVYWSQTISQEIGMYPEVNEQIQSSETIRWNRIGMQVTRTKSNM